MSSLTKRTFRLATSLLLVLSAGGRAEQATESTVTLPWQELSHLLELDKDEITLSWQDFLKILEQSGTTTRPPVQIRQGEVVLQRAQLSELLAAMKPPREAAAEPAPPADFLITKGAYRGILRGDATSIQAQLELEILKRDPVAPYLKIPLFPQSIALRSVSLDGKPALVVLEGGHHCLISRSPGSHRIIAELSVKTPLDRNRQAFSVPIPVTPMTTLSLDLDQTEVEVEIGSAQYTRTDREGDRTLVEAVLAPTTSLAVSCHKSLPEIEKGPAKVYAEVVNHLTIEDDALRISATIALSVLQNTIQAVTVKIPQGSSILDVKASGLGDWREVEHDGVTLLEIPFDYPQNDSIAITITAEKLLPEATMAIDFSGFEVIDAIRDKGFLGVELKSTSEVTLAEHPGLDALDLSELPASLVNRSQKPLLFGFKYLHHPFSLTLDIAKHDVLPVIDTVVDAANGVTLFTEDGKLVHRIIYNVRNTTKQFLELELPPDAQIWSVFVAGDPVKPRVHDSKVLIPLNRSRQGASGLVAFDVELIFFEKAERFAGWGTRTSLFPVPDVIISQMLWSVYLPIGYTYFDFAGTVEPEVTARGLRPLLNTHREIISTGQAPPPVPPGEAPAAVTEERNEQARALGKRFSANLALEEQQLVRQMENEALFSQRVQQVQTSQVSPSSGILPIRIQIPTTGQVYRFAKTIVSDEELSLSYRFVSNRRILYVKAGLVVLLLMVLYLLRGVLLRLLRPLWPSSSKRSGPALLVLLALVAWFVSHVLSVLLALAAGLWLAVALLMRRLKEGKQPDPDGDEEP